jgi:hypothetical protein
MASNILRRSFATASSAPLKIGLIPADGIGREGKRVERTPFDNDTNNLRLQ